MKTIPVNAKDNSDKAFFEKKGSDYSYAFHKVYSKFNLANEEKFIYQIKKKYNMNDIEYRSLVSDVSTRISQTKTNKEKQEERIVDISDDLKYLAKKEKSNNNTRSKFKKHNKIKQLDDSLPRNITFGGKETLRDLTKLHNNIPVIKKEKDKVLRKKLLTENKKKIDEQTKLWKEKRVLSFYIVGEANQEGNRFFDFNFYENTIIYKPYKGKKIEIKYSCGKKQQKELLKLKELIDNKSIPCTLTLRKNKICISYDDEILSGYCIDKKERKKEVKALDKNLSEKERKELVNAIYIRYYDDLKTKQLSNKIQNRYASFDKNPDYLGYCIADRGVDGIEKIIEKGVIDFTELNKKLGLPSDHPLVIAQNNKRKNETCNALKLMFNIFDYYKVAYFVDDDIDGITENEKFISKEANRKVRNTWQRKLIDWQILKRCTELGIIKVPSNPVYTSFIGNLMYNYFDATNSAIEICRRGMYFKGLFYPPITGTILDTMRRFFEQQNVQLKRRDALIFKDCEKWDKLHKIATDNGLRWRWDWEKVEKPYSIFRIGNTNSKVKIIRFSN